MQTTGQHIILLRNFSCKLSMLCLTVANIDLPQKKFFAQNLYGKGSIGHCALQLLCLFNFK